MIDYVWEAQQPPWPDPAEADAIRRALAQAQPVVLAEQVIELTERLAAVAAGESFVVTSGDCAETFTENTRAHIAGNLRVLSELADALSAPGGAATVPICRLAGQYAKPRSAAVDDLGLPVYRGDAINSQIPSAQARRPDPRRMLWAHEAAIAARAIAGQLTGDCPPVYLGHEALLLDYEHGLLRDSRAAGVYASSGHFLWIGERTRQPGGSHLALAAAVANPVGVKLGPTTTPGDVQHYARLLNSSRIPGKLTFITRMGASVIWDRLPVLIEAVRRTGIPAVWQCDPMHGNTVRTSTGRKTRHLCDVLAEVSAFFDIHRQMGSHPGGVHVEATGEDVTECVGADVTAAQLPLRYRTACDPRLNRGQARELAALLAGLSVTSMAAGGSEGMSLVATAEGAGHNAMERKNT